MSSGRCSIDSLVSLETCTVEIIQGVWKVFSTCLTVKAETDVWNSHSASYKCTVWAQIGFGILLLAFCIALYCRSLVGTPNSTVSVLLFLDYLCICCALNNQYLLGEKSFASQNFSEFWLFGFFKGDDYMANVIVGWLGALCCTGGIIAVMFFHQSFPISLGAQQLVPHVVRHPAALVQHPVPLVQHTAPLVQHGAPIGHHNSGNLHHHAPVTHHISPSDDSRSI